MVDTDVEVSAPEKMTFIFISILKKVMLLRFFFFFPKKRK